MAHTRACAPAGRLQAVGGLCFTVAALIELHHNLHATWRDPVLWVCVLYLIGSVLFFGAASVGLTSAWMEEQARRATRDARAPHGGANHAPHPC
eukprot:269772-Prymnesium_polylepis.1